MLAKLYEQITSNLFAENRLLKFVVVVIGAVQIYNSHQISVAMNNQRTILVPQGLDRRVQIQGDRASADYIRVFARVISNLAFTYQYTSARAQFGELVTYFTPETMQSARKTFDDMATTVETTRANSSFAITQSIQVDTDKNIISITGVQRQWVDGMGFIDAKGVGAKTYQVSYVFRDGKFAISGIQEREAKADKGPFRPEDDLKIKKEGASSAK